jgi:hypothetical protein
MTISKFLDPIYLFPQISKPEDKVLIDTFSTKSRQSTLLNLRAGLGLILASSTVLLGRASLLPISYTSPIFGIASSSLLLFALPKPYAYYSQEKREQAFLQSCRDYARYKLGNPLKRQEALEKLKSILASGPMSDSVKIDTFRNAVLDDHVEIVKALLSNGCILENDRDIALMDAAAMGYSDIVKALLAYSLSDYSLVTAIKCAALRGFQSLIVDIIESSKMSDGAKEYAFAEGILAAEENGHLELKNMLARYDTRYHMKAIKIINMYADKLLDLEHERPLSEAEREKYKSLEQKRIVLELLNLNGF